MAPPLKRSPTGSPFDISALSKTDFVRANLGEVPLGEVYDYASVTTQVGKGTVWALVTLAASVDPGPEDAIIHVGSYPLQGTIEIPSAQEITVSATLLATEDAGFTAGLSVNGEPYSWAFSYPLPEGTTVFVLEANQGGLTVVSAAP